jgi:hypothetical protein
MTERVSRPWQAAIHCPQARRESYLSVPRVLAAECPRRLFDLGAVVLPPARVVLRQIRVIGRYPRDAVQLLAQDVGVPGVPVGLADHVDQDVEEHDHRNRWRPPGHPTRRVEGEGVNSRVRVSPRLPVRLNYFGA